MAETTAERASRFLTNMSKDEANDFALTTSNGVFDKLAAVQTPEEWSEDDETRCTVTLALSEWSHVIPALASQVATEGMGGYSQSAAWSAQIVDQIADAMVAAQKVSAIPAETALSA